MLRLAILDLVAPSPMELYGFMAYAFLDIVRPKPRWLIPLPIGAST